MYYSYRAICVIIYSFAFRQDYYVHIAKHLSFSPFFNFNLSTFISIFILNVERKLEL